MDIYFGVINQIIEDVVPAWESSYWMYFLVDQRFSLFIDRNQQKYHPSIENDEISIDFPGLVGSWSPDRMGRAACSKAFPQSASALDGQHVHQASAASPP